MLPLASVSISLKAFLSFYVAVGVSDLRTTRCALASSLGPVYTETFATENTNFSLRIHISFTRKCERKRTKTFSLRKRYPKWKLLKTQQTKRSVNAENANVENANAEKVFYQAWSNTKVGVDSEKPWQKRLLSFPCKR